MPTYCQDPTCPGYGQPLTNGICLAIEHRRERAYRAVLAHTNEETLSDAITDLLTDLLHLADQYGGADDHLETALMHYRAETDEHQGK